MLARQQRRVCRPAHVKTSEGFAVTEWLDERTGLKNQAMWLSLPQFHAIALGFGIFAALALPSIVIRSYAQWLERRSWRRTIHVLIAEGIAVVAVIFLLD